MLEVLENYITLKNETGLQRKSRWGLVSSWSLEIIENICAICKSASLWIFSLFQEDLDKIKVWAKFVPQNQVNYHNILLQ